MRIALIGCGSIGRKHLANLQALGERDRIVYDVHAGQMAYASGTYDVPLAPRLDDLWDWRPDAVLICTPPSEHLGNVRDAIQHGVQSIFLEKPLAGSVWAADVIGLWIEGKTAMVACNLRYHAGPATLRRWLDSGAIGDVISARFWCGSWLPSWHGDGWNYRESYAAKTGAILDVGSHEVDLALHLLGSARLRSAVVRSAATIGLPSIDGLAEMTLKHDTGVISSVHVNFVQRNYDRGATIIGTKGTMGYSWGKQSAYCLIPDENRCHTVTWEDGENDEMYRRQLAEFLACVREGKPSPNPVSSAVKTLDLLLEAQRYA